MHGQENSLLSHSTSASSVSPHILDRLEHIWNKAYSAESNEDLMKLYAEWAATYDEDHEAIGFFGHIAAAELMASHVCNKDAQILDAGVGTGAAGTELARRGFSALTGADLSTDMLAIAEKKKIYRRLIQADLGVPIDEYTSGSFDAAILVGVFSYGQAPACALDEMIRLVRPGGVIVFTMRTDFYECDAMSVRSRITELEESGHWKQTACVDPKPYLPNLDPKAMFRVWCYHVTENKVPPVDEEFAEAALEALTSDSAVKNFDHRHIWNSTASRLYNSYIECPEYYLNDCEEEILDTRAEEIVGEENVVVELGCGSARKIKRLLVPLDESRNGTQIMYVPIDLSPGALEDTSAELNRHFNDSINIKPVHAPYEEGLSRIPQSRRKLITFFGSSIGNLETLHETIDFLKMVRGQMSKGDRFIVGMDLHKDEAILRRAYEAGDPNRLFFLNMVRRINDELGGGFDLGEFVQESTYDWEPSYRGIEDRCVNFRLKTKVAQKTNIQKLGLNVELRPGESIQVGRSRKFNRPDIKRLAAHAGLALNRQWMDERKYFSINEMVPAGTLPCRGV